jgi:hypothetical protein
MKKQVVIISFLLSVLSHFGQSNLPDRHSELKDNLGFHKQLGKEFDAIQNEILSLHDAALYLNETVLDSSVKFQFTADDDSVRISKRSYKWYNNGFVKTRYEFTWNSEELEWTNYRKTDYTWNEAEQPLTYYVLKWDVIEKIWMNYSRTEYTWTDNGDYLLISHHSWDKDNNIWLKGLMIEHTYDEDDELLFETWWNDDENNEWQLYARIDYLRNEEKQLIKQVMSYRDDANTYWVETLMEENTYYTSGLLKENVSYTNFDKKSGALFKPENTPAREIEWDTSRKFFYAYDNYDNMTLRHNYIWENGLWVNDSKSEYTYDDNNNTTLAIWAEWDAVLEQWVNDNKVEYEYLDDEGIYIREAYRWDVEFNNWVGESKFETYSNAEGKYKFIIDYVWDEQSMDWIVDKKEYYYRSVVTGISQKEKEYFSIYPNPFKDIISIQRRSEESTEASLLSMSGQAIMHFKIEGSVTRLQLGNLPEGVYFLQLNDGSRTTTHKVVKR